MVHCQILGKPTKHEKVFTALLDQFVVSYVQAETIVLLLYAHIVSCNEVLALLLCVLGVAFL